MSSKLFVQVCTGPTCSLQGGPALSAWCRDLAEAGLAIELGTTPCTGNCCEAPVVTWNGRYLTELTPDKLTAQLIADDLL